MKLFSRLTLALFVFAGFSSLAQDYQSTCAQFSAPLTGGYCVHVPVKNRSRDIVYHLHGRGGSTMDWQDPWYYTSQIRAEWKRRRKRVPTVVSVSFGPVWLLAERNASPYSGLFEAFTQQVMPTIEASLGGLRRGGDRIVFGESMGGLNTIQLAMKTKLFKRAAVLCAPMSEVSPFAPWEEIQSHVEKSSAYDYWKEDPERILNTAKEAVQLAKTFFSTPEDWQKSDPLVLVRTSTTRTDLYITAGHYDIWALFEGNEKFARLARSWRRSVEWHPLWGGHCAMDIKSLADFLID